MLPIAWLFGFLGSITPTPALAQTAGKFIPATSRDTFWTTADSVVHFRKTILCFPHPRTSASTFKLERKNLKVGEPIILPGLYFSPNKAEITGEMLGRLQYLAAFLKANPDLSIEIGGHTNNNPTSAYAADLSTQRAKVVADWLVAQGLPEACIQYKGYGKRRPIADNQTPEGRKQNMRVDMTILEMSE
ncbi:MAG: OmpA family protein [Saprospiraceae bacterium]